MTFMLFFFTHYFVALALCFGLLSWWKTHPQPIVCFWLREGSVTLAEKQPIKQNVSTSALDHRDVVFGSYSEFLFSITPLSRVHARELDFGFISESYRCSCICSFLTFWPKLPSGHYKTPPVQFWLIQRPFSCTSLLHETKPYMEL